MNIFIIPSWYPTSDDPLHGIFNKEQAIALAKNYPSYKFCISIWGQKNENNLLFIKDHFLNLPKIINFSKEKSFQKQIEKNLWEFYKPALTWTKKIFSGNIDRIISSNKKNLKAFETMVGRVDIIHAHTVYPGGCIASKLSTDLGIPYIVTEHISPFPSKYYLTLTGKINNSIDKAYRNAKSIIVVSPQLQEKFKELGYLKTVYIPNLSDESFFKPSHAYFDNRKFIFFTLGRMVEQKGISVLLEAIGKISHQGVIFRIGGAGEELTKYKALGEKVSASNIYWLGELDRNETKLEFQNCNAFVLSSLHESMGVVFAEAIACGKPIIATKCGGPESIVNEKNGLLAEVGDSQDLADKIDWMVENYHKYDSKIIREDFLQRFSRSVVSSQIVDVYKKVIGNKI